MKSIVLKHRVYPTMLWHNDIRKYKLAWCAWTARDRQVYFGLDGLIQTLDYTYIVKTRNNNTYTHTWHLTPELLYSLRKCNHLPFLRWNIRFIWRYTLTLILILGYRLRQKVVRLRGCNFLNFKT